MDANFTTFFDFFLMKQVFIVNFETMIYINHGRQ
jgi:hypothetical protein